MRVIHTLMGILRRRLRIRRLMVLLAHIVLYAVAFFGAFLLRFDFSIPSQYAKTILMGLTLMVVIRTFAGQVFGLYGGVLKYAGIIDLVDILKSMTLATLAFVVVVVLLGIRDMPRSIIVIDWFGSIMLIGGLRFGLRAMRELLTSNQEIDNGKIKRVAIIGAGDAGETLVRELLRLHRDRYEVVGFLDDNPAKRGLRIHDIKVMGSVNYLGDFVARYGIDEVIIAIPTASGEAIRRIVDVCKVANVRPRTIPGFDQLIDGKVTLSQIRDVAIEDLLGRKQVELDEGLISRFVSDKVVMVTGAGGSIGSELCRQIARYIPEKLVLVEQAEPSMFEIYAELQQSNKNIDIEPVIGDVNDGQRMRDVFTLHRPEVIFHAAAHKHVPLMEANPGEAIKNNIIGTKTVADLADMYGTKAFVFISTDKAVNPTSVMGATKRVSEMYVQAKSCCSRTKYTAVRFGNVLGSTGSVIPIFKQQIAKGGPVTVTHPEMLRYFMTIPEACQLVMQAGAMGEGGEIFALDMGRPVKIVDLATDLITLSGFKPNEDIEIVFTGVRPGEKLFEELGFDAEKMSKTRHPKIFIGKLAPCPLEDIEKQIVRLLDSVQNGGITKIRNELKNVVPEYSGSKADGFEDEMINVENRAKPVSKEIKFGLVERNVDGLNQKPNTAGLEDKKSEAICMDQEAESNHHEKSIEKNAVLDTSPNPIQKSEPFASIKPQENPDMLILLDGVWERFLDLCRQRGFVGAGWNTYGLKPPDERKVYFDEVKHNDTGVIRRSVSITSLAFINLSFLYSGKPGKKAPPEIIDAAKNISVDVSSDIRQLHPYAELGCNNNNLPA